MDSFGSERDPLTDKVIGAAIEVHRCVGPGVLESAYEECFCYELGLRGIAFERQMALPLIFKGMRVECAYRLDVVIEGELIAEVKAVERLLPIHDAQLITYLRMTGIPRGLLLNFNESLMKNGIKRIVNRYRQADKPE